MRSPVKLAATIFCKTGSLLIQDNLYCGNAMKLGSHSAPDLASTGLTVRCQ